MDKIMSLFAEIGELLNTSSWFQLVQWPFWTLLVILAFCGVYTARFGKKKLVSLAFQSALKLALIYMVATVFYVWLPSYVKDFSELPFFSVSSEALTLVNPLGLLERWNTALPRVFVRLYFLLFFINAVSVFDYSPVNFLSWFFFQFLSGLVSFVAYAGFFFLLITFWPGPDQLFYNFMALLLTMSFLLLFMFKFYFTFIVKGGNATFQSIYMFLTNQTFGKQFTVSALSFLIVVGYLLIASIYGHSQVLLSDFNPFAFLVNGFMCTMTLYAFSRYFNG